MTSLRSVLRANAASCLAFGVLFAAAPDAVAAFLGDPPELIVLLLGLVLIANGAHLIFASLRRNLNRAEVIWFSLGDLAWWLASLALLAAQLWVTTAAGVLLTWLVAIVVASLGLAQLWLLGRASSGLASGAYWRRMGTSWLALPNWVKVWLFALNGIFLAALVFVPSDLSRIVLTAYVASGPLMLAFVFFEGGLSRTSGIGHLIPWSPMMAWLALWLAKPGPSVFESLYGWLLFAMTANCLAFDVHDLRRWWRGERAVLGVDGPQDARMAPVAEKAL